MQKTAFRRITAFDAAVGQSLSLRFRGFQTVKPACIAAYAPAPEVLP
jgi:hypothetical protein